MARQVNDTNQIWFEKIGEVTNIGFTNDFLNTLDQCWHVLPANLEKFRAKSPLLTLETNDALISIVSPVSGNFVEFSGKAQNFPNKLTEDDVVLSITERPAARPNNVIPQAAEPRRVRLFNPQAAEALRNFEARGPAAGVVHWPRDQAVVINEQQPEEF